MDWPGLQQVFEITRTRTIDGQTTMEKAYGITSLGLKEIGALELLETVRGHWAVENKLHWCLDVQDREDWCRVRVKNAAENFSRLRRLTMNLLRQDTSSKASIRVKRKKCSWKLDYMFHILGMGTPKSQMR